MTRTWTRTRVWTAAWDCCSSSSAPHGVAVTSVMSVLSSRSSRPRSAGSSRQIVRFTSLFSALDIDWTINPAAPTQLMIFLLVVLLHVSGGFCAHTLFLCYFIFGVLHHLAFPQLEMFGSEDREWSEQRDLLILYITSKYCWVQPMNYM